MDSLYTKTYQKAFQDLRRQCNHKALRGMGRETYNFITGFTVGLYYSKAIDQTLYEKIWAVALNILRKTNNFCD
jgi:hypothetical protein